MPVHNSARNWGIIVLFSLVCNCSTARESVRSKCKRKKGKSSLITRDRVMMVDMPSLASTIEAILYLKGQPLPLAAIAEYAECDRAAAELALIELLADYAHRDSALEVVETNGGYSLQLRASFENLVQKMIPAELGTGALRTLAAIALAGPISQPDLVNLRGQGAYQHVQELVDLGFVRKRRQSGGRSYWLQVTDKFHQNFELDRLPEPLSPQ